MVLHHRVDMKRVVGLRPVDVCVLVSTLSLLCNVTQGNRLRCAARAHGYCYLLRSTSPRSWQDAADDCDSFRESEDSTPGTLAAVYNAKVEATLSTILNNNGVTGDVWVGGRHQDSLDLTGYPTGLWRWTKDQQSYDVTTACEAYGQEKSSKSDVNPGALDIAFFVDTSGSMDAATFDLVRKLMKAIVNELDIGPADVQVSIMTFGNTATIKCDLDDKWTADEINLVIDSLISVQENTNIHKALELMRTAVFQAPADRAGAPNVAIGFTDGLATNRSMTLFESMNNHDEGIATFMVGTGNNIEESVVSYLSTPPRELDLTYWLVRELSGLSSGDLAGRILASVCSWQRRLLLMEAPALPEQGCVMDWVARRDLPHEASLSAVTPPTCVAQCAEDGYTYAGVQATATSFSDKCFCGNEFGANGTSSDCRSVCKADPSYFCGGINQLYVYRIQDNQRYFNWEVSQLKSEPNNLNGNEFCGAAILDDDMRFSDKPCSAFLRYACEVATSSCQGDDYYSIAWPEETCIFLSDDVKPWYGARQVCYDLGGDLLTLDTKQRYDGAVGILPKDGVEVWLGLYRLTFYWKDEQGGTEFFYNNFAELGTQPDLSQGECLTMRKTGGDYKWFTTDCRSRQHYICQIAVSMDATSSPVDTSPVTSSEAPTTQVTTTAASATLLDTTIFAEATTEGVDATTSGVQGPGGAGASSGDEGGLDTVFIVLIIILCLLALAIIIFAVLFLYYKKRSDKKGVVTPEAYPDTANKYDARPKAPVPESGYVFDPYEGYSDTASSTAAFAY